MNGQIYVITEKCVATCDTACVDACPVDAIHGPLPLAQLRALDPTTRPQMFIDPMVCICCAQCEPVCPVNAIYRDDEVPKQYADAEETNAAFFRSRP